MNNFDEYLTQYKKSGMTYLRTNIPEIQKIESLDGLKDLKLQSENQIQDMLILKYETTASNVFPTIRQRLIESGKVNKNNIMYTSTRNKGTPKETYNIGLSFYGARLQIHLEVHK
jgi:hypothetical protein